MFFDVAFFAAALHKVFEGGWFPLLLGAVVFAVMLNSRQSRRKLQATSRKSSVPLQPFLNSLFGSPPQRVPGAAVFFTSAPDSTPHALLHSLKHYKVLHECNVFLTVEFSEVPWVRTEDSISCDDLGNNCWKVIVRYGFMDRPDVGAAVEMCGPYGLTLDAQQVSYFLSRD